MELISVLMCVYNTPENYLREAIESILNQTYKNIELVLIDDFSNDSTQEVLNSYSDSRIVLYRNSCNLGLTKSLNIGLSLCKGVYVARMDSDDIAESNRLEKQLEYIKNTSFYVIGSKYDFLPYKKFRFKFSEEYEKQRVRMIFGNAGIVHSTAFFDKRRFDELHIKYNEKYLKSQDYGMWCECINKGLAIGLCPDKLIKWRESENQISVKNRGEQEKFKDLIREEYILNNFHIRNLNMNSFIKNISLQTFLKECSTREITNLLNVLICNNIGVKSFEQEIIRYWFYQCLYRIKYKHKVDFLFTSFSLKCLKPKNFIYLLSDL